MRKICFLLFVTMCLGLVSCEKETVEPQDETVNIEQSDVNAGGRGWIYIKK